LALAICSGWQLAGLALAWYNDHGGGAPAGVIAQDRTGRDGIKALR
jgi:hypothetical protein